MSISFRKIRLFVLLNLRTFLKSPTFYFFLFVPIIFFTAFTVGTVELIYIGSFSGTLLISTFFCYGYIHYKFKSFAKKSFDNNKYNEMIGGFLLILFINTFLFFWILFIFFILLLFPYLLNLNSTYPFPIVADNIMFSFKNPYWGIVFYYIGLFTLLNYSMAYFFSSFSKKLNNYLLLAMSYIILTIFYGGIINTNFELDSSINGIFYQNNKLYAYPVFNEEIGVNFFISQFVPVYHVNQFCFYMFLHVFLVPDHQSLAINLKYFNLVSWQWMVIIFAPYFWIFFYLFFGKIIKYYK